MSKILIADDDPQVRAVICRMLVRSGYTVVEAEDGRAALRLWGAGPDDFDLLITDILMPEKDGFDAIIEFRKIWPKAKIIAITGGGPYKVDILLRTAEKLGVRRTLQKPFDRQTLLDAVRETTQDNSTARP